MQKAKFTIYVEDYNVTFNPWYILNSEGFTKHLSNMTGKTTRFDSLFLFEENFVTWGTEAKNFIELGNYFANKIEKEEKFIDKVIQGHYKAFDKIKIFGKKLLAENLQEKTNKQLFQVYKESYDLYSEGWKWGLVMQYLDMSENKFSEKIKKELRKKLKKYGNPEVIFSRLITPTKESYLSKENIEVLKVIKFIKDNNENINEPSSAVKNKIKKLVRDFGWLQFYYFGPPATENYYYDLIKKRIDIDVDKELEKKKDEEKNIIEFQKKYKSKISEMDEKNIETLKEFTYLKELRKEIHVYYLNYVMDKWFKEVARRFHWSPSQARCILKDEYEKILNQNKKIIDSDILNDRYKCSAYLLYNGKLKLICGKDAKKYKEMFLVEKINLKKGKNKIEGTVAYPGKVKGIAKIVNSTADLDKFNDNDVLISYATNPSLVPAMNKASAIVTNVGGITCHAAIVSRELRTPCIIGTKIATKVLKDGDEVEVDANKGIVKIIK